MKFTESLAYAHEMADSGGLGSVCRRISPHASCVLKHCLELVWLQVRLVSGEMGAQFAERGTVTPPWRSVKSLLSKWLPTKVRA